jgi:mRNA-degrading endonuclease RelE of RelBE toxin-antitoxin system
MTRPFSKSVSHNKGWPKEWKDLYRLRVGEYRGLYQIRDEELIVLIIALGHRREI